VPRNEIAAAVGIAPFFLDDVLVPARRMSAAALERSFRRLYQSDRTLKSARIDPDLSSPAWCASSPTTPAAAPVNARIALDDPTGRGYFARR